MGLLVQDTPDETSIMMNEGTSFDLGAKTSWFDVIQAINEEVEIIIMLPHSLDTYVIS